MKKKIILITALILVLCGCEDNKNDITHDNDTIENNKFHQTKMILMGDELCRNNGGVYNAGYVKYYYRPYIDFNCMDGKTFKVMMNEYFYYTNPKIKEILTNISKDIK